MGKALSHNYIVKLLKNNNIIIVSGTYKNCNTKLLLMCKVCGYEYYCSYSSFRKSKCASCSEVLKHSITKCREVAALKNGRCLSSVYNNAKELLQWECAKGHMWHANFDNIKNKNKWCAICAGVSKHDLSFIKEFAGLMGGECLSKSYKNAHTKLSWQCKKGHTWMACFDSLLNGKTWCPSCKTGRTVTKIKDILCRIYPDYKILTEYNKFGWLKNRRRMRLDLFVPEIKLAIEYDGEQHFKEVKIFGGESKLKYIQKMDKIKNLKIANNKNDIKHFVRISFLEKITEGNIRNILQQYGVPS
jgi:hypothetical protein